ncbi:hypothetical protein MHU86_4700 [Fragilaria crotonensis]|nr:hypothetical protein MHU86_4700 [Fragilaria crotonensis]
MLSRHARNVAGVSHSRYFLRPLCFPRFSQQLQLRPFSSNTTSTVASTSPAASVSSSSSSSPSPGKLKKIKKNAAVDDTPSAGQLFLHAGLPLVIFSLLAAWVLKNSIEGKNKEYDASKGKVSKSYRQARMDEEHADMIEKLNKIRTTDFDNTKRIERPEEILERRKREREARNVWYRRWGRWLTGQKP